MHEIPGLVFNLCHLDKNVGVVFPALFLSLQLPGCMTRKQISSWHAIERLELLFQHGLHPLNLFERKVSDSLEQIRIVTNIVLFGECKPSVNNARPTSCLIGLLFFSDDID